MKKLRQPSINQNLGSDQSGKAEKFLFSRPTQKRIYFTSLFAGGVFLSLILYTFFKMGIFTSQNYGLIPGDIDLSGTWKIKFEDKKNFKNPSLDDSSWCLIGAPHPISAEKLMKGPKDHPAKDCPAEAYPKEAFMTKSLKSHFKPCKEKWILMKA